MFNGLRADADSDRRDAVLRRPPAAASIGRRSRTRPETNVGINVGGGVKMTLAGPLRLRLDYRVFTLKGIAAAPDGRSGSTRG